MSGSKTIKIYHLIIVCLFLLEICSLFLTYQSYKNKSIFEEKEEHKVNNKRYAMYVEIENEDGTSNYEEYNDSNIFPMGYKINLEKSKCTDTKGNLINGILSGRGNKVTVTSNKTAYCYVYFDIDYTLSQLCSSGDNLGSCLIDNNEEIDSLDDTSYSGMYRYTGTNDIVDDNYICFGTTDKNTCVNNPDKYMYRVIGVTSEANDTLGLETNQLKLVKYISLEELIWANHYSLNKKWDESVIYENINSSSYLTNSIFMPGEWNSKIDSVKWNIGDVTTNPDVLTIYELEKGLQTSNTSKIGLIYLSDLFYAYVSGGIQGCNSSIKCDGWIINNSNIMWTMSRYGEYNSSGNYYAWGIRPSGNTGIWQIALGHEIYPTFFLNSNEIYISGDGTFDNPIMLKEPPIPLSEYVINLDTKSDIGLQQEIIEGDDLYRFSGTQGNTGIYNYICLGTTNKCESGSDNMYRIIGVNPNNGEIKVIKETPWNNGALYVWHNSNSDTTWLASALYTEIVKEIYNELSFKDMIVENHNWNVGIANSTSIVTRTSTIDYENNAIGTANVGIMSLTDYYLAYNGDRNWFRNYDITTNWIGGYLNGNTSSAEWTMTYYGYDSASGYYRAWNVYYGAGYYGYASGGMLHNTYAVRPVFYLSTSVNYVSGSGTSTDPFIIE